MTDERQNELVALAADITAAYVAANKIGTADLPGLLKVIHGALAAAESGSEVKPAEEPKAPAISVRRSVTPDYLVCLEDGRRFKSLKRHLRTKWNLSPEEYRTKWGLPRDYPMVAPNYAKARSDFAKSIGLGQKVGAGKPPHSTAPKSTRRKTKA